MGKGWIGFALVCGLSGCEDGKSRWVPPDEDAAVAHTNDQMSALDARAEATTSKPLGTIDASVTGAIATSTQGERSFTSVQPDFQSFATDVNSDTEQQDAATRDAFPPTSWDASTFRDASEALTSGEATRGNDSTRVSRDVDASAPTSSSQDDSTIEADSATEDDTASEDDAATDNTTSGATSSAGGSESSGDSGVGDTGDAGNAEPIRARAGFIDVEGVEYGLMGDSLQTSSARLFYAFTPANDLPEEAPVFVFFNGGPGSATSSGLLSYGTGNQSLPADLSAAELAPNPWSWAEMGNLLYFDTRQAGFSYSTLPDPSDPNARAAEWTSSNFNLYVDAADSIRLMLRVLSAEPALRDNPIILVGESYGGTRATMMLRFLLMPDSLRSPVLFQDVALADEIQGFFQANAGTAGDTAEEQAKRQLPAQVLIQPFFAANQFPDQDAIRCLPGSPAQEVALEVGSSCESIELYRDAYKINEPATWSDRLDELAQQTLMHPTKLPTLLGVELSSIEGLAAAERSNAYREPQTGVYSAPQPEFITELGQLQAWDAYHLTLTPRSPWSSTIYTDPYPCVYFSWVAQQVDTFITNAKWDNVVLTTVLPTTLFDCSQLVTSPFVDGIAFDSEAGLAMGESGQMVFQFNERAPQGASETEVEIRGYEAGHMVTVTHAEALLGDVRAFLVARGVL